MSYSFFQSESIRRLLYPSSEHLARLPKSAKLRKFFPLLGGMGHLRDAATLKVL